MEKIASKEGSSSPNCSMVIQMELTVVEFQSTVRSEQLEVEMFHCEEGSCSIRPWASGSVLMPSAYPTHSTATKGRLVER